MIPYVTKSVTLSMLIDQLTNEGCSEEFLKEYTEGKCGGPGAVAPGKFLIFEVTQPYFLHFLNAKLVWKVHK